jgi:hypothetical protein
VEKLPYDQQVNPEQSMLRTFGRVMPVLMPLGAVLVVVLVVVSTRDPTLLLWLRIAAAICIAIATVTTLTANVPIIELTSE